MDEIGSMALCTIADALTGRAFLNQPHILIRRVNGLEAITTWHVPVLGAAVLVETIISPDRYGPTGTTERSIMTALPAKDEEAAWRIALNWIEDWELAHQENERHCDDSPF